MKVISREKTAWPGSYGFVVARKLYCFAKLTHLGVLALAERPKDKDKEVKSQKSADTKAESQRSKGRRGLESKLGDFRPTRSGPELEDK